MQDEWTRSGEIGARLTDDGALEICCDGLTTQAKYYKPLLREFFRRDFAPLQPGRGDYAVHIRMDHIGDPPWMDLDNLAKALLDSVVGYVFEDDRQVARLLVERRPGDREGIWMRVEALAAES